MVKTEISAGGLVVKKNQGSKWQVLLMKDMNGNWTFPKGLIDKGEKPEEAAVREIFEEVGLKKIKLIGQIDKIHYFYNRGGLISKTVYYFLFSTDVNEKFKLQVAEGISDCRWIDFEEAENIIGYPKINQPLLKKAFNLIPKHGN